LEVSVRAKQAQSIRPEWDPEAVAAICKALVGVCLTVRELNDRYALATVENRFLDLALRDVPGSDMLRKRVLAEVDARKRNSADWQFAELVVSA
jgi:hypothetical protein